MTGLYKLRLYAHDLLKIIKFTNNRLFLRYVHEHIFSVSRVREAILRN